LNHSVQKRWIKSNGALLSTEKNGVDRKMTDEFKHIGIFAVIGVLAAILIIAGVFAGGFSFPSLRFPGLGPVASDKGMLLVKLTDAPVDLTHLNVTIDSVYAHRVADGNETWEKLGFVGNVSEVYVDILSLQNVTMDLSLTEIPAGNYTKLRLSILTANATYATGENVTLRVPSDKIDVIVHFEIKPGETTKLLLDMQADWVAISRSKNLRPVLKATVLSGE